MTGKENPAGGEPAGDWNTSLLAGFDKNTLLEKPAEVKPDLAAIRDYLRLLHEHAAFLAAGFAGDPGKLVLIYQIPDAVPAPTWFNIGQYEEMAKLAYLYAEGGHNVYAPWRTVRRDIPSRSTGTAEDTVIPIALAVDNDSPNGMSLETSLTIETSKGHQHDVLLLDRVIPPAEARDLGRRLRAATGTDTITGSLTFPVRIPGTLNYPNATKRAIGRGIETVGLLERTPRTWSPDELRAILPEIPLQRYYTSTDYDDGDNAFNRLLVLSILAGLPNDGAHYDIWRNIGFALHATGWSDAFQIWDKWSRKSSKYRERKQSYTWAKIKPSAKSPTIATIFYLQCGWSRLAASNAIGDWLWASLLEDNRNAPETRVP